jgi:hypothetical protein
MLAIVLTVLFLAFFLILTGDRPASRLLYNKVEIGMTREEVNKFIGPQGNYATDFYTAANREYAGLRRKEWVEVWWWVRNDGQIEVGFNDEGIVCGKEFCTLRTQGTLGGRIRLAWLRLRGLFGRN